MKDVKKSMIYNIKNNVKNILMLRLTQLYLYRFIWMFLDKRHENIFKHKNTEHNILITYIFT